MPEELFKMIKKDALRINGILYAPPNFLKMGMYLELSRPIGDNSRFEKVFKRLALLNKTYPLTSLDCHSVDFQRTMNNHEEEDVIYETTKDALVHQGVVFFGGFAISLYSKYMPAPLQKKLKKIADFDVISNDPETTAEIVKERLKDAGITKIKIKKNEAIGEIIPMNYEIKVGSDTIAFIYEPVACHSYNVISIGGQKVRVATIDTMLSFYLAFLYANRDYYREFSDRILCMSKFLFDVQQKNRLEQKGLLKRFSILCYGHQPSVEEMRAEKAEKFKELKDKKGTEEYESWFLNYRPEDHQTKKPILKTNKKKKTERKVVNPYNKTKKRVRFHF
jgi:hypothetical protein